MTGGLPGQVGWTPSELELGRQAYRRSRGRRSTLVALISTLSFAALAYFTVTNSPGWSRVQATFFSRTVAKDSFPKILQGLWLNVQVLVVGGFLVLVFGLAIAVLRTLRGPVFAPLRILGTIYVDIFRGVPLIITLYLVGFGFPALGLQGVPTSPFILGTAAIVLTYSAYVAEVFRAGIESVHPSQRAAARSLGLTHRQRVRIVVLPQALRTVTPTLLNDFVALQKDVGLISVLGAVDAVRQAQILTGQSFNFTPYVVAGLLFVLLALPCRARPGPAAAVDQAHTLLSRIGLADKANDYPDRLSGTAQGMTILMATHEMGFAKQVADRVAFLDAGLILEQRPPAQVLGDPVQDRTRQFLARVIDAGRL